MTFGRLSRLLPILVLLTACGDANQTPGNGPDRGREVDEAAEWAAARRTDAEEIADGAPQDDDPPADQAASEERFPCTVIARAEIEELLGNAVEPPAWSLEEVADAGASFDAETCSWLTFAESAGEIVLQVGRPEHFADGAVVCWEPDEPADDEGAPDPRAPAGEGVATSEPEAGPDEDLPPEPSPIEITDLGSTAWWFYDPATAFGSLQVCHPQARIAVEVNAGGGEIARRAGVTVARRVLEGL